MFCDVLRLTELLSSTLLYLTLCSAKPVYKTGELRVGLHRHTRGYTEADKESDISNKHTAILRQPCRAKEREEGREKSKRERNKAEWTSTFKEHQWTVNQRRSTPDLEEQSGTGQLPVRLWTCKNRGQELHWWIWVLWWENRPERKPVRTGGEPEEARRKRERDRPTETEGER